MLGRWEAGIRRANSLRTPLWKLNVDPPISPPAPDVYCTVHMKIQHKQALVLLTHHGISFALTYCVLVYAFQSLTGTNDQALEVTPQPPPPRSPSPIAYHDTTRGIGFGRTLLGNYHACKHKSLHLLNFRPKLVRQPITSIWWDNRNANGNSIQFQTLATYNQEYLSTTIADDATWGGGGGCSYVYQSMSLLSRKISRIPRRTSSVFTLLSLP